jgi:hypothetical protein
MKSSKILVLLAATALTTVLQAAKISIEVQVPGYSGAGWVKVMPELRGVLKGRVAHLPQYGGWVTDRVSRGEMMKTTFAADRPIERNGRGALVGVAAIGFCEFNCVRLPYSRVERVTRDAKIDNVFAWTVTEAGYFDRAVPIGAR